MLEAFTLGLIGSSSLVLGAWVALAWPPGRRLLGMIMAFGAGVLISAVAYELVATAFVTSDGEGGVGAGLIAGALTFFVGEVVIERFGGGDRKDPEGAQAAGSATGIVLGTVLDGIPESIVLGVGLVSGESASIAMLCAVFISNLPEAIASTVGLRSAGWPRRHLLVLWLGIALVSGLAAAVGFAAFDGASNAVLAFVLAYAGGAVLTMLADTMMPEAFANGGTLTGVITTIGFGVGFLLAATS